MKQYEVECVITRKVVILVTADSQATARAVVDDYGIQEAVSDFEYLTEDIFERIGSIRVARQ